MFMKLSIQLVPQTCFYKNVRQILTPEQWKYICRMVYSKYWYQCSICSGVGDQHPVEGHEIWEYDDVNNIQILKDIVALCPMCHLTVHFGYSQLQNKDDLTLQHFMKINSISKKKALQYIKNCFKIWKQRSTKKWTLDLSYLKKYGLEIKEKK